MKKCYYCNSQIINATKIMNDGIKYICKNDDDIKLCNEISQNNEKIKKNNIYIMICKIKFNKMVVH